MNICIFCSAYVTDYKYTKPAEELATLLAQNGHHLVWGGSDVGLMSIIAAAFRANGGKLYGISIKAYTIALHKSADEMIIAKDLGTRKASMLAKSDLVIALPGGIGTLDELTEIIELKKQKHHDKAIIVLNTDNFYEGLIKQIHRIEAEGFIPNKIEDLVTFLDSPEEVNQVISGLVV